MCHEGKGRGCTTCHKYKNVEGKCNLPPTIQELVKGESRKVVGHGGFGKGKVKSSKSAKSNWEDYIPRAVWKGERLDESMDWCVVKRGRL